MNIQKKLTDVATIVKKNGTTFEKIAVKFSPNVVLIGDSSLPIEEGDVISRELPNGLLEKFEITDRGFHDKHKNTQAHYQARIKKVD